MSKTITYLLPGPSSKPIGGYKIIYEYANRFVADGYSVNIVFPVLILWGTYGFKYKIYLLLRFLISKIYNSFRPNKWFDLDRRVKLYITLNLNDIFLPKSDIYIATAIETVEPVLNIKSVTNSHKFYFIQGFENWGQYSTESVFESYSSPINKIVISKHLQKMVKKAGSNAYLVHNGFDFKQFYQKTSIINKDKFNITMLYHNSELKGCVDGVDALKIVKKRYPKLTASFFGKDAQPEALPDWITYYKNPKKDELNAIYNNSAIYIGTSYSEGFGLVIGEAMMCGSAVACTNIGGYTELAINEETALLSPIKDPQNLAKNIMRLIQDDDLRISLAKNANANIQNFTWGLAFGKMKDILFNNPNKC